MFLNNFIKIMSYFPFKTSFSSIHTNNYPNNYKIPAVIDMTGQELLSSYDNRVMAPPLSAIPISFNTKKPSDTNVWVHLVLGSGTTPPTPEDYKLEQQITSGLSGTNSISSFPKVGVMTHTYSLTNTSEEPITISEAGLRLAITTTALSSSSVQGTNANNYVLLTRDVLDEPIVIPPGETKSFTYTLDYTKING